MKNSSFGLVPLFVSFASLLFLGGCSDPACQGTDCDGDDPVAALDAVFQAACERQVECGYPVLNTGKTVDQCVELQRTATGEVSPTLGDGAVVLRADRLIACKDAFEAATCEAVANHGVAIDEACTTYWEGTVEDGEACHGGVVNDCHAGSYCAFDGAQCPGVCTKMAAACVEGSCAEGEYCDLDAKCAPRAALGGSCGPIVAGALFENSCVDGAQCQEGTCVARLAAGQACTGAAEFECVEEHTCQCDDDACSTLSCQPAAGEGEACNIATGCAEGRFCDFAEGKCAVRGEKGAACSESLGACKPGLACLQGECDDPANEPVAVLPLLEEGASCEGGGICPLGTTCLCDEPGCPGNEKWCLPGPKLGEDCSAALQVDFTPFVCAEGLCDVFETYTCIQPAAAGSPCTGTQTLACGSFMCVEGKCATLEETRCEAN